jgi:ribosomal protein S27E
MKINCLSCGHKVDLDDSTYEHYHGQVKCFACGSILEIEVREGKLDAVRLPIVSPASSSEEMAEQPSGSGITGQK